MKAAPQLAAALGIPSILALMWWSQRVPTIQFGDLGMMSSAVPTPHPDPPPQGGREILETLNPGTSSCSPQQAGEGNCSQGGSVVQPKTTVSYADRQRVKALLVDAARRYDVNPGLVMGVVWWESGWDQSQVSVTSAVGVMQVEPYAAETAGPRLLHRKVDIHDLATNIDLGTAILRDNIERYQRDLTKTLVAYYAGPGAITDWRHLDADVQRYVMGVYALVVAFDQNRGPA